MRYSLLYIIFLLSNSFLWGQSVLDKKIDFQVVDTSLKEALIQLSIDNKIGISFSSRLIPDERIVTIQKEERSIKEILDLLLENTNIAYKEDDGQIILYKKPPPPPKKYFLSGYIRDAKTGEPLIGATVYDTQTDKGSFTNNYGYFSIQLTAGEKNLQFSYTGYSTLSQNILLEKNSAYNFELNSNLTLQPVVITADKENTNNHSLLNKDDAKFPLHQLKKLPTLGGEVDFNRASHLLAGVQTGTDGVGGLLVRGGSFDQNLILLDEAPIFNPSHAIGIFSIFNTDASKSMALYKGNFPARYAGRLSSVADIRTKEGNLKQFQGAIGLGVLSGKVQVEGPIIKDKCSFFVSARHSLTGFYIPTISRIVKERNDSNFPSPTDVEKSGLSDYSFYDINAKINFQLSPKDHVFISSYWGKDDFFDENVENYTDSIPNSNFMIEEVLLSDTTRTSFSWGNRTTSFRWNHIINSQFFSHLTLGVSNYNFASRESYHSYGFYTMSNEEDHIISIRDFSLDIKNLFAKIDFEYALNEDHFIRFGASRSNYTFQPGVFENVLFAENVPNLQDSILLLDSLDIVRQQSVEYDAYLEDDIILGGKARLSIGLHLSSWIIEDTSFLSLQPRLTLHHLLSPKWKINWGFSKMTQNLHFLSKSNLGLPGDIWVPATKAAPPAHAYQFALGIQYKASKSYEIGVESYYKKMSNLVQLLEKDSLLIINAEDWEANSIVGLGNSYGVEFSLKKKAGKLQGWINYTLAWSERQFAELNDGQPFPFRFNKRHSAKLALIYQFNKKLSLSTNWIVESGIITSLPIRTFPIRDITGEILIFDTSNYNIPVPSYQRLDIALKYNIKKNRLGHAISFEVFNVYNRPNPLFYKRLIVDEVSGDIKALALTLLPILPSIHYTLSFE